MLQENGYLVLRFLAEERQAQKQVCALPDCVIQQSSNCKGEVVRADAADVTLCLVAPADVGRFAESLDDCRQGRAHGKGNSSEESGA